MRLPTFLRRSLRNKVTGLVVATTLAALVMTALALVIYNVRDYRATKLAEMRTQAEIIGRAAAPALSFNDRKEATRDLAMLDARADIEFAALYAVDGALYASYARSGEASPIPQSAGPMQTTIEGDQLTYVYPIVEEGQRMGTIVLMARYGLRARLLAYLAILAGVMAVAMIAALLLSVWLQRAVTEPILRVAEAARGVVERRDFSLRTDAVTEDEIGVLAYAMNRMLIDLDREIQERRGAESALRAADRRKDEFLATLAHELRNPLAPIRNALYLLQAAGDDARTASEARAIIDRQVRQMVRLVDDLLEVSRITTGKLALRRERVDLRSVALAALEAAEPLMRDRGHRLNVSLPPPGLMIQADPTRLAQVFLNLLNNAAKFSDPGGRIDFLLEVRDGEMIARVRDEGIGIPPEMLEPIFEMFAQADRSLERTTTGLGVGLSLSLKLMELHGGTIEAKSEGQGKGSEFVVRMPAAVHEEPASPEDARGSQGARVPAAGSGGAREPLRPRVLVVDDNTDFADTLGRMLEQMGHDVRVAHDGLAGLEAARAFRPHIAFLDIGMPQLNGYELARRLRALPATAASVLIAVTGWGQYSDRQAARDAGFDEHVVKPLEIERLQTLLQRFA
jgi:signal transduction histidine kinase